MVTRGPGSRRFDTLQHVKRQRTVLKRLMRFSSKTLRTQVNSNFNCNLFPCYKFLEDCPDVVFYTKNYYGVQFKIDYVNTDGDISIYYPNFIVKLTDGSVVIVETKGLED